MPHMHLIIMTFELTGNMFALLLVGVACAFEMVGHVQQIVRRMAKHSWKEVSEVLNTSPNMRIWSFLETAIYYFTSCSSLILIDLAADFMG